MKMPVKFIMVLYKYHSYVTAPYLRTLDESQFYTVSGSSAQQTTENNLFWHVRLRAGQCK